MSIIWQILETKDKLVDADPVKGIDGRYHYIYLTENLINGKMYLGKRTTNNLAEFYMGSGKALHKAMNKYGRENFKKIILNFHESKDAVSLAEEMIVDESVVKSDRFYNMMTGGYGGDLTRFYKNQTATDVAVKSAQTLKSRPEVLKSRNKKIGDRINEKMAINPDHFKTRPNRKSGFKGKTKENDLCVQMQVANRRKNHLEKMNKILDDVKVLSHLSVPKIAQQLNISESSVYRCRLKIRFNLRWEDPIPPREHGLKGTTADKCPWRAAAAEKVAKSLKGKFIGDKSGVSKLSNVQRQEIYDMVLSGVPRHEIHAKFIHIVTKGTINRHMRIALEKIHESNSN